MAVCWSTCWSCPCRPCPCPGRTSTSCATVQPWSTSAALITMQRNYRSLSFAAPAWGLRRGPSSSEPYRPSSSPSARMPLLAEHSPPGSQRFRNIATPNSPETPGEGVGQQAAHLYPPGLPGAHWNSVPRPHVSCFFSWGGDGARPPFYTLSAVDEGTLVSSL